MRRFFVFSFLTALFAFLLATTASGAGPSNQFAVGSAKTDTDVLDANLEHLSFSAHDVNYPPNPCFASGSAVYDAGDGTMHIKVDVEQLVINPSAGTAYFAGPVTSPAIDSGLWAQFDVFDREALEANAPPQFDFGGFPATDAFQFDGLYPPSPCRGPAVASNLVTSGNIVIKATGPLTLP